MVVNAPRKPDSVFTSLTRLKNLLGDTEVAVTVRYCLVIRESQETLAGAASSTSEGLCRWIFVAPSCRLLGGLPLGKRTGRHPWMWY
jgi:hypothetical protein